MAKKGKREEAIRLDKKIENLKKYIETPEGVTQLKEAIQLAQNANKQLREASRVDRQSLLKPVTL